ncbi:retrotransposon protein, putative, ty1-copia subclass, partial [Tanacetum coccineum]
AIQSDQGGEYLSHKFVNHMKSYGIISQLTLPYTPQHNKVFERRNQTLLDMVRSMMNLQNPFGDMLSRLLLAFSIWFQLKRLIGCLMKYGMGNLPGYPKEMMGYYFYYPLKNKIFVSRNVEFFENSFIVQEASGSYELLEMSGNMDVEEYELGDLNEPPNYKVALADPESNKWLEAMNTEMQSMKDNQVWYLVDLPSNGRTVGCKWLFKKKTDMDGNVHTFKACLVAKV